MKEKIVWAISVFFMGVLGSTARYIHNLGVSNSKFSFKGWSISVFIGCTVSIIAGLISQNYGLSVELTFAIVGLAAISSKEIIEFAPGVIERWLAGKVK